MRVGDLGQRQFDIVQFAWVSSYDPGFDALWNMHSANVPSRSNGFQGGNYGDYKNPRNDQLLNQLQSSIDPAFRRIALFEALVFELPAAAVCFWIAFRPERVVSRALHLSPAGQRAAEGDLVRVLEVAAHGEAAREPRDADASA